MTDRPDDAEFRRILSSTRVIAVEGMTDDPAKPSHYVPRFLQERGYRVIPVNPDLAGKTVLGETAYATFADIPGDIAVDMVDIFRRPNLIPGVVSAALADLPQLRTVWMQLGLRSEAAATAARAAGKTVVQDACPKMEIPRLFGTARPIDSAV